MRGWLRAGCRFSAWALLAGHGRTGWRGHGRTAQPARTCRRSPWLPGRSQAPTCSPRWMKGKKKKKKKMEGKAAQRWGGHYRTQNGNDVPEPPPKKRKNKGKRRSTLACIVEPRCACMNGGRRGGLMALDPRDKGTKRNNLARPPPKVKHN